ncbi:hypothetical protein SAMN05421823_108112 [Catalinimonas alkaloidigena]|uniref:Uncharacterized protein n=1 Tax=Catalinimonas alkaloidigena TaxID=1075417 RepID=A0A1G9MWS5_9BACT|nr:hypothetical protein [Catalinimonas alkaloidigena]SDL78746.1 hypothetical protein SAMN05421823_108112 [Catalinimonas alkaloidigena]
MKRDIDFPTVEGVHVAIARQKAEDDSYEWRVYLLNQNPFPLDTVLVASKGYGESEGEAQRTSTLRHLIEYVAPQSTAIVERIDPAVFHLVNEYWVSYYVEGQIHDKKFLFLPDSIVDANLSYIPELELEGVLHS